MLFSLLALACSPASSDSASPRACADGFGLASDGNCYPLEADADTDADSDADTDADSDTDTDTGPADVDADGDGYGDDVDCDDADASVNPGVAEVCDGLDNDCDSLVDDADDGVVAPTYVEDVDGDRFGVEIVSCEPPATSARVAGDCYDANAEAYPESVYGGDAWRVDGLPDLGGDWGFHVDDRGDGSWDFDCDGVESLYSDALEVYIEDACGGGDAALMFCMDDQCRTTSPEPACGDANVYYVSRVCRGSRATFPGYVQSCK